MDDSSSLHCWSISRIVEYSINLFSKVRKILLGVLSTIKNKFLRLVGVDEWNSGQIKVSKKKLESIIELGEEQGVINQVEKEMLNGVIKFESKLAKEVMTPRTETFCLEVDTDIRDCIKQILEENYSRIPIYQDNIDNIVGIVYMKDLFKNIVTLGIDNIKIRDLLRKPYIVPETNSIDKVMKGMQESKNFMSILMDEYGGFSGIVTLEDLVEEVIGDIWDEYDKGTEKIQKIKDNTYIVSGLTTISEVNKDLDLELQSEDIDTIGGYLLEKLGSIPEKGSRDEINVESINFKVLSLDDKRIDKIQITKL